VAVERHRADAVMMVRGVESLVFLMNMISLELCRRPTQIHRTNVTPGARFLSLNPSALELFPRRLLATLGYRLVA
jgi:hypothetical protein